MEKFPLVPVAIFLALLVFFGGLVFLLRQSRFYQNKAQAWESKYEQTREKYVNAQKKASAAKDELLTLANQQQIQLRQDNNLFRSMDTPLNRYSEGYSCYVENNFPRNEENEEIRKKIASIGYVDEVCVQGNDYIALVSNLKNKELKNIYYWQLRKNEFRGNVLLLDYEQKILPNSKANITKIKLLAWDQFNFRIAVFKNIPTEWNTQERTVEIYDSYVTEGIGAGSVKTETIKTSLIEQCFLKNSQQGLEIDSCVHFSKSNYSTFLNSSQISQ